MYSYTNTCLCVWVCVGIFAYFQTHKKVGPCASTTMLVSIRMCTCTRTLVFVFWMCVGTFTHPRTNVNACVCTSTGISISISICIRTHVRAFEFVWVYFPTPTNTYMCIYVLLQLYQCLYIYGYVHERFFFRRVCLGTLTHPHEKKYTTNNMCTYIHIHIHIHTHTHIHIHTITILRIHIHIYAYTYTCTQTFTYTSAVPLAFWFSKNLTGHGNVAFQHAGWTEFCENVW